MSALSGMKNIREDILKNKDFFLLNFINDIPDQEELQVHEPFSVEGLLSYTQQDKAKKNP